LPKQILRLKLPSGDGVKQHQQNVDLRPRTYLSDSLSYHTQIGYTTWIWVACQSSSAFGTLGVDGWAFTFGTARRELGGAAASLYQM